jgi:hypothetical protein
MAISTLRIDHSEIEANFIEHLVFENNSRILFSGPFGTGKSTFLEEISARTVDRFFYIKLIPVNYSVASNDDVFELIKFDILIELMNRYGAEIDIAPHEFPVILTSQVFLLEQLKASSLSALFGSMTSGTELFPDQLGDYAAAAAVLSKLNKAGNNFLTKFKEFRESVRNRDQKLIKDFFDNQERKSGINEGDKISFFIKELIQRVKQYSDKQRQSVLVIDDLDRLDPEHIFRLFNIFSAHYDSSDQSNKFGFDKVIFVCDLENIKKIYHHRYGPSVDFSGYIDKFFSTTPFDFDNRAFLRSKIIQIIESLEFNISGDARQDRKSTGGTLYNVFEFIVISLLQARQLTLRNIINYPTINLRHREIPITRYENTSVLEFNFLLIFDLLKGFFHTRENVVGKVDFLSKYYAGDAIFRLYAGTNTDPKAITQRLVEVCAPFIVAADIFPKFVGRSDILPTHMNFEDANLQFDFQLNGGMLHLTNVNTIRGEGAVNPFLILLHALDRASRDHIIT